MDNMADIKLQIPKDYILVITCKGKAGRVQVIWDFVPRRWVFYFLARNYSLGSIISISKYYKKVQREKKLDDVFVGTRKKELWAIRRVEDMEKMNLPIPIWFNYKILCDCNYEYVKERVIKEVWENGYYNDI